MISKSAVNELKDRFPGANIVALPPDEPREGIAEVEPTEEHPEYSVAVALIERSKAHHHNRSTETYRVLGGSMMLFVGDEVVPLAEGQTYVIKPGILHSVIVKPPLKPALVEVTSEPGWSQDDHILEEFKPDPKA